VIASQCYGEAVASLCRKEEQLRESDRPRALAPIGSKCATLLLLLGAV